MPTVRAAAPVVAAVLLAAGCSGPEAGGDDPSPQPLPTAFGGEAPPGVGTEVVRYLHGPGAEAPDIVSDERGIRITAFGSAFLISANSAERHAVQRAADGDVLWEGELRVDGFLPPPEPGGPPELRLSGEGGAGLVVGDDGEVRWEGASARDDYVAGLSVTRPEGWSPEEPHGEFTVDPGDGADPWTFAFTPPEDGGDGGSGGGEAPSPSPDPDDPAQQVPEAAPDPDRMGVPVGAGSGVVLLDDGAGLLQARATGAGATGGEEPGTELWNYTGDDPDLLGEGAIPRARPEVVGVYRVPEEPGADAAADRSTGSPEPAADESAEESGSPGADAPSGGADGDGSGDESAGGSDAVLLRWSRPEEPSLLSLHDLETGDIRWTLAEPGANPGEPDFALRPLPGTVFDPETGTLLVPQAGGATPMIAVDTATGAQLWEFGGDDERAMTPVFAAAGQVYADARGPEDDGTAQVVFDAPTKDVRSDGLDAYVEAISSDGYAIVAADRQRFVFAPPPGSAPGPGGEREEGG
ncbi:hypothetical protein [Nocardiopsis coralliicola]